MDYVTSLQNGMVRIGILNSHQRYKGAPKLRLLITKQHGVIFQETEVSVKNAVMPSDAMRQSFSNSTAEFVRRDKDPHDRSPNFRSLINCFGSFDDKQRQ
jgi:hypothetical protein